MSVIVINCVTLGSYQPCRDISVCDGKCQILKIVDDVIFAYFAAEMIIKMVGNNHIISLIIDHTTTTHHTSSQGGHGSVWSRVLPRRELEQARLFHRPHRVLWTQYISDLRFIFETFSCSRLLDYFEFSGGAVNLTAIRTVRVLRPLRAINRIPSMFGGFCVF